MYTALILKFLKSKFFLYGVLTGVLAFACYKGYHAILDKGIEQGIAQMQPEVDAAVTAQKKAEGVLANYKTHYDMWVAQSNATAIELQKQQDAKVSELTAKLSAERTRYNRLVSTQREVERYVSPKSVLACPIPRGFVSLWNDSIENPDTITGNPGTPSITGDVDSASGVDLLAVARASQRNNAQAMYWRAQVIAWQDWYATYTAGLKKVNEDNAQNTIFMQKNP